MSATRTWPTLYVVTSVRFCSTTAPNRAIRRHRARPARGARSAASATTIWPSPAIPVARLTRTGPNASNLLPRYQGVLPREHADAIQHDVGDAAGKIRGPSRRRARSGFEQRMRDRLGGHERGRHHRAEEVALVANAKARGQFARQRVRGDEIGRRGVPLERVVLAGIRCADELCQAPCGLLPCRCLMPVGPRGGVARVRYDGADRGGLDHRGMLPRSRRGRGLSGRC